FKIGTINIGNRQNGRLQSSSVINCECTRRAISGALENLYSSDFQSELLDCKNPYGEGGASKKIVDLIRTIDIDHLVTKSFYDLPLKNTQLD
ncbi:MAG: UDP-N-acetylglucosamine 2-epimerase, partial [bacterium]